MRTRVQKTRGVHTIPRKFTPFTCVHRNESNDNCLPAPGRAIRLEGLSAHAHTAQHAPTIENRVLFFYPYHEHTNTHTERTGEVDMMMRGGDDEC